MKVLITENHLRHIIKEVRNKEEDRNKIYQDENILVVAPLTHRSSCKYGANTKWCVAVPSTDEHFNEYMEHGVLVYFIIRSPHKNTKKTEYKFAYYHPFDDLMGDVKGWYDMSDNQLNTEENVDMNLIKFLIPDEIFQLVKEYIKTQRPIWKKRQKENREKIYQYFITDVHNTLNEIVNNNEWFISYRTLPFQNYEFYKRMNFPYVYLSPNNSMTVMYVNKKTKDIFAQQIHYYKDLRNYEINGTKFIEPIQNIYTENDDASMVSVFDRYYPQILSTYFKSRKSDYKPDSTSCIYIPVKYVNLGDNLCGLRDTSKIHKIYNNPQTNRINIDVIDSRGGVTTNSYYSDDVGVGLKYDSEKHNPQ